MGKREELAALMDDMKTTETTAMAEAHELFQSEDMKLFTEKLQEFHEKTVPNGHYDQVLGSVLSVLGNVKMMLENAHKPADEPEAAKPVAE